MQKYFGKILIKKIFRENNLDKYIFSFESIKVGVTVVGSVFLSNLIALSSNSGIQPQKFLNKLIRKKYVEIAKTTRRYLMEK